MTHAGRLRFGVIGCGVVSGYGHLPAISALGPEAELVAVVDSDEATLAAVGEKYPSAQAFTDYRKMLAEADVDMVTIATRTDTHVEIASACLAAGKHVLLEKPPAVTVSDAYQLADAARDSGLICAVDFILRYQDANLQMKRWYADGEIGRLRAIRIINSWWGADHRGAYPGRGVRLLQHDGSVIVAEGIHQVDLVRWFSDSEFGAISCMGTAMHHGPYQDYQVMTSILTNDVVATLESSHAYTFRSKDGVMDRQTDLIGEEGVIKWYESLNRLVLHGRDRTVELTTKDDKNFQALYLDLIASVRAGKPVAGLPTIADGAKAMEVVFRAAESARNNSIPAGCSATSSAPALT